MGLNISAVSEHKCGLGEGPLWDADAQALYWVDSLGPTLYRLDYETQETRVWHLSGETVGSLSVREQAGWCWQWITGSISFHQIQAICN